MTYNGLSSPLSFSPLCFPAALSELIPCVACRSSFALICAGAIIGLEEGWERIYRKGILRLQAIVSGSEQGTFTNKQYMELYTYVHHRGRLCSHN
jgi:hypothetical protein